MASLCNEAYYASLLDKQKHSLTQNNNRQKQFSKLALSLDGVRTEIPIVSSTYIDALDCTLIV